jgi:hypothetical protein
VNTEGMKQAAKLAHGILLWRSYGWRDPTRASHRWSREASDYLQGLCDAGVDAFDVLQRALEVKLYIETRQPYLPDRSEFIVYGRAIAHIIRRPRGKWLNGHALQVIGEVLLENLGLWLRAACRKLHAELESRRAERAAAADLETRVVYSAEEARKRWGDYRIEFDAVTGKPRWQKVKAPADETSS